MEDKNKYTKMMAELSANMKYADIPKEVVEQAKMLTMQTLGVAIGAYPIHQSQRAIKLTKDNGGKPEATILVDGTKVPMEDAAFVNATLADILDWEDCCWTGHPAAGAIPGALAVAEATKASGKDYLTAVVASYEVYQRIAMAVQSASPEYRATHSWGMLSWQIYASLIAAAKILKLDTAKTQQALGVALYQANIEAGQHGRPESGKSDLYHYAHGFCARDGVTSTLIAQDGIDGMYGSLDGPGSFPLQITDTHKPEWYSKKGWLIMETLFKHWPTNVWIQTPLDALDAVVKENNIKDADIKEITLSPYEVKRMAYRPEGYATLMDAEFSVPFAFAAYLLDPEPGADWYAEERLTDPKLLALASKVKGTGATSTSSVYFKMFQEGSFPTITVTITLNNSKQFKKEIQYPKGHPKNRLTWDELKGRFRRAAFFGLNPSKIEKAIDAIVNLERMGNISEFVELLHK